MTTAVHFDLDGTLLQFTRPYGTFVAEVLDTHLGRAPDELVEAYDEAFYERFVSMEPAPVRGAMRAVVEQAHEDGYPVGEPNVDEMVATLSRAEYAGMRVSEGVPALLDRLDAAGCRLGVLTNGLPEWQTGKLDTHGLTDRFEAVVTSYGAGAHKPDAAIFAEAAERIPADRHVMVGDDFEPDVQGARDAGWSAIHLDGITGARAGSIADLEATLALLGGE
ncbi:HAD family hydrolase [Haloglomus halophilum]|uniref:HAD family hydrolase n=1 Tax=Haloglomus halophilum TaxID=2962672 RepID=UPI0020C98911|nr:HAD family hydrolase [Haloglomus halophilum]